MTIKERFSQSLADLLIMPETKIDSSFKSIKKEQKSNKKTLNDLQKDDYEERQKSRKNLTRFTMFLIIAQHIILIGLLVFLINTNEIKDLQALIGTIISGTLLETYGIMRLIVKFNFSEIFYKEHQDRMLYQCYQEGKEAGKADRK